MKNKKKVYWTAVTILVALVCGYSFGHFLNKGEHILAAIMVMIGFGTFVFYLAATEQ